MTARARSGAPPAASRPKAVTRLLEGLVDYAGLFPPAQLGMAEAVAAYATYRLGPEAWMLGRFVVPAARLREFAAAAVAHLPVSANPWRLSALVEGDAEGVPRFNDIHRGRARVDTLEAKAGTPAEAERVLTALSEGPSVFVEVPLTADLAPLLAVLKAHGARAKVRTGGVRPEMVPTAADLARFLAACAKAGVAFKATAGLHHPLRSVQPFTYAPDSLRGTMHGFLNVFTAAAFVGEGMDVEEVERLLLEERPSAIAFEDETLVWDGHRIPADALARGRRDFALGFGSCSFLEPIDDLRALGLL